MWVIMCFIIYIRQLVSPHNSSMRQRAIIVPILQIRKVGLLEVRWLVLRSGSGFDSGMRSQAVL